MTDLAVAALHTIQERMIELAKNDGDIEAGHVAADGLLIDALHILAGTEAESVAVDAVIEAYQHVDKWFA